MSAATGHAGVLAARPARAAVSRRDPWRGVREVARYVVLILVLIFCLFPIVWVIGMSVKLPGEYMRNPPDLDPAEPDADPLRQRDGGERKSGAEEQRDYRHVARLWPRC